MRTVRASTISTKSATTSRTMIGAIRSLLFVDERCRALDLHDLDPRPRLDHLGLVEGAGAPDLAADLHAAPVSVGPVEDEAVRAHERGRARAERVRHAQVRPRDRPEDRER